MTTHFKSNKHKKFIATMSLKSDSFYLDDGRIGHPGI
jgi:hypothetical protein